MIYRERTDYGHELRITLRFLSYRWCMGIHRKHIPLRLHVYAIQRMKSRVPALLQRTRRTRAQRLREAGP